MAGGFTSRMAAKKNKYIEEWNGKRELVNRPLNLPVLGFYVLLLPFSVYLLMRSEFKSRGDRRYKDII